MMEVKVVGERLRMTGAIGLIGFIGFLLGIAAQVTYFNILPVLISAFPQIFALPWMIWGLGGALLSVICCIIYAYID